MFAYEIEREIVCLREREREGIIVSERSMRTDLVV